MSYTDNILITWRKGTSDDPFVPYNETIPIINGQIVLTEIPDPTNRVEIQGYFETDSNLPESNQYNVNYDIGLVTFNMSENNKSVSCSYLGRGVIKIPASRIFAHDTSGGTDVVKILQEIIDTANDTLKQSQDELIVVNDASNSTKKIWETPLVDFATIQSTYQNPPIGTTVQALDTGNTYRYNGASWDFIESVNTTTYSASRTRPVVFVIPDIVKQGVYNVEIRFPFSGTITDVYATCGTVGTTPTTIGIENCSASSYETDSPQWRDIFSTDLTIDANKKSNLNSTIPFVLSNTNVSINDHFRINVISAGTGLKDLTIEMMVQV